MGDKFAKNFNNLLGQISREDARRESILSGRERPYDDRELFDAHCYVAAGYDREENTKLALHHTEEALKINARAGLLDDTEKQGLMEWIAELRRKTK